MPKSKGTAFIVCLCLQLCVCGGGVLNFFV